MGVWLGVVSAPTKAGTVWEWNGAVALTVDDNITVSYSVNLKLPVLTLARKDPKDLILHPFRPQTK